MMVMLSLGKAGIWVVNVDNEVRSLSSYSESVSFVNHAILKIDLLAFIM